MSTLLNRIYAAMPGTARCRRVVLALPAGRRRAEHFNRSLFRSPFSDLRVWAGRSSPSRRRRHASRVWSPFNCIVTA